MQERRRTDPIMRMSSDEWTDDEIKKYSEETGQDYEKVKASFERARKL